MSTGRMNPPFRSRGGGSVQELDSIHRYMGRPEATANAGVRLPTIDGCDGLQMGVG